MIYFKRMDILLGTRKKITWWNEVDETMDVKGLLILATFLLMEPSTIVAPEALSYVRTTGDTLTPIL